MISSIPKWMSNVFGNTMRPNAVVLETAHISPQIKKIKFKGDISKWNFQIGHASVIRVSETEFRNYTISDHDKAKETFEIIFHIHGQGTGSRFIDALKKNDKVYISAPRGKKIYHPNTQPQFFFGDETCLGVAIALSTALKSNRLHHFEFYFELNEENKNVPQLLGLENYTVFPKNNLFRNEEWIETLPLFQTEEYKTADFALAGNVKSVQTFRKVLKRKTQGNINFQGYWLEGKKGL